ncbi:unnamed protein product [Darwinula stevensoni]|uniref:DOMON domain-containing protein n=1 Tax=Darwinula stevensoni TaxID=69355 RepID=A0A7R9FPC4_9CRUS|nr:unnamed protein product [Darwinula stevensoni]CAG0897730.1 unnamed protein product [Darwinula stevensoni]
MGSKAVRFTLGLWLLTGGISLPHVSGWEREAILDPLGKVQLAWTPHLETKVIEFEYTVQTLGWVGLGFSPTGGMRDSDVITAWIKDGQVFFNDRHVPVDHELPRVDDVPNYNLISAVETDTATIIRFSREFDTCDLEQDFYITGDTIKVIYAYGETDPDGADPYYHGIDNRGTKSLYLLDPPLGEIPDDPSIKEWIVSREMVIPEVDTTYWCSIQKTPVVDVTNHIIGYKPYVKPGNEKHVHHLLLYACSIPDELVDVFNSWAEHDGVLCYGPDHPQEWYLCRSILIAWAVGGERSDRLHTNVQIIPSGQKQFFLAGHCSSLCTSTVFPPEGIHVFSGLLHSHLIGRKMRVRVFRNGEELPWLLNDDNYDFNYQQVRVFREHITLYPGDQLIMECDYDSSNRDSVTVSGYGTAEEMCLGFFQYYPALNLAACFSYPKFEEVFSLFGITDLWVDQDGGFDYMVSENQTLVDYLNEFDWSGIDMEGFQDLMR